MKLDKCETQELCGGNRDFLDGSRVEVVDVSILVYPWDQSTVFASLFDCHTWGTCYISPHTVGTTNSTHTSESRRFDSRIFRLKLIVRHICPCRALICVGELIVFGYAPCCKHGVDVRAI